MPFLTFCPSWTAGASRLIAGRAAVWAWYWAGRDPTEQEALRLCKRRKSLVLRKALRLSLADRQLLVVLLETETTL